MKIIERRKKLKESNQENLIISQKECNAERSLKYANRSMTITSIMIEDVKKLVKYLGLPCKEVIYF